MSDTSANLVARWRDGDEQAAADLFQRYAGELIALAHQRLSSKLAARVAAEDVIQSVYCTFFTEARNGRYVLENSGDLWRLLVAITIHKVHHHVKRHTAGKRAVHREQHSPPGANWPDISADALSREPSPAEAVTVVELINQVLGSLDPLQARMVELRLQGHTLGEIMKATARSRATVQRVLDKVRDQLAEECFS